MEIKKFWDCETPVRTAPERPIPEMWQEFCNLLAETKRPGIGRLLNWMQSAFPDGSMNFLQSPASTRFHGAYEGGLLEHSLHVYNRLVEIIHFEWKKEYPARHETPEEQEAYQKAADEVLHSAAIVALLHDLCKIGFYTREFRNKKVYSDNGSKQDAGGRFDWVSEPKFAVKDTHMLGHGSASVELIERFLGINGLTEAEKYAITYHMGDFQNERATGDTYNRYPLATMLHMADIAATYLDERGCDSGSTAFWANLNAFARPVKKEQPAAPAQQS